MWKLCFMWKNVEKRFQKFGLSTILLKSSHGLSFFVSIFRFICESDFTKTYSLLLEQNSKNKMSFSQKCKVFVLVPWKFIEMLWKSLSLMAIQKFPLLKLNFCWSVLTTWVIISAHKYHICVLLFITFHLICNMSMFRDTWNLTNFQNFKFKFWRKLTWDSRGVLICYS